MLAIGVKTFTIRCLNREIVHYKAKGLRDIKILKRGHMNCCR
jgi:hypothetical protein